MDNTLSYCEFKMDVYNFDNVSDDVIKNLITGCDKDNAMFAILFKCKYQLNPEQSTENVDYFVNLVNNVARVSGFDYSDDELKIYRMFAIPVNYKNVLSEDMLTELINNYEEVDLLKVSNDSLLYAQEYVRYKLLQTYVDDLTKYYDKMKNLLARLKNNQEKYKELENTIYERLNKREQ